MIIKALAENTSISEEFGSEHGLSMYIETNNHKLIFDTGRGGLFFENAEKMGIDLTQVDVAFISHGHFDHGGGLSTFLKINQKAVVYVHENAFGDYYSKRPDGTAYIGLDKSLQENERIFFVNDFLQIDDELSLFSGIENKELLSLSNKSLLMKKEHDFVEDSFVHEQNLIINENGKTILIAGCAHNGIVNITERFFEISGHYADVVIGGFHLFNPSTGQTEDSELINAIGERLKKTNSQYYTCHCTGLVAYKQLQEVLGNQIKYMATGCVVEI